LRNRDATGDARCATSD